jgi:hypothetical protein
MENRTHLESVRGDHPMRARLDDKSGAALANISILLRIVLIIGSIIIGFSSTLNAHSKDYSPLLKYIQQEVKAEPLIAFDTSRKLLDMESHAANMEYLNKNPEILAKIRAHLGSESLEWYLTSHLQRLLYVPERREDFVHLYQDFCSDVVQEIMALMEFKNPYNRIVHLDQGGFTVSSQTGIAVYLVHNLVKEYEATYVFNDPQKKQAALKLSGKVYTGEIGSYASYLQFSPDGEIEFTRSPYSIWQTSGDTPYSVLVTPVEETFHVVLRPETEMASVTEGRPRRG